MVFHVSALQILAKNKYPLATLIYCYSLVISKSTYSIIESKWFFISLSGISCYTNKINEFCDRLQKKEDFNQVWTEISHVQSEDGEKYESRPKRRWVSDHCKNISVFLIISWTH